MVLLPMASSQSIQHQNRLSVSQIFVYFSTLSPAPTLSGIRSCRASFPPKSISSIFLLSTESIVRDPSLLTASESCFMDAHYIDPSAPDSRPSRSRSNSRLSQATSQFQDLDIKSSTASTETGGGTSTEGPTATTTTSAPSLLDPNSHPTSTFTSSPTTENYPPFPQFSQTDIDAQWPGLSVSHNRPGTTPLLRLDPAEQLSTDQPVHSHPSISRSNSYPVNMRYVSHPPLQMTTHQLHSTVGVQYDSRFDAGIRQTYTWPSEFFHHTPPPIRVMLTG